MRTTSLLSASALAAVASARAPLKTPEGAEVIEGKYIVMMKDGPQISSSASIQSAVGSIAADADLVYKKLGGFAASLTEEEVEALRDDPNASPSQYESVEFPWLTKLRSSTSRRTSAPSSSILRRMPPGV